MSMTLSGNGTITGLVSGGLPDGTVLPADLSTGGPYWDTSGNLGIGTSSPSEILTLARYGTGTVYAGFNNGTVNSLVGTSGGGSSAVTLFGNTTNHPVVFFQNNTERARIDTSGNLQFNSGYGSVATAYGCRAWVNFNGTGTVAIRASGNVSSITDRGTGEYTINFTTSMPDANYTVASTGTASSNYLTAIGDDSLAPQANGVRIVTRTGSSVLSDTPYGMFSIFR